jgi:hypothetical protein
MLRQWEKAKAVARTNYHPNFHELINVFHLEFFASRHGIYEQGIGINANWMIEAE